MRESVTEYAISDGFRIVNVDGEIDIANAGMLERRLLDADDGASPLILSLVNCSYIDSSGLRVLIRVADDLGDRFVTVAPPDTQVRRITTIAGLDRHLNLVNQLRDALARVRSDSRTEGIAPAAHRQDEIASRSS